MADTVLDCRKDCDEMKRLQAWIADLQSDLYVNCVYCGHRYGPGEEKIPADALRRHIATARQKPSGRSR